MRTTPFPTLHRYGSALICAVAIACLTPSVTNAQSDDFNDGDDAGWTHIDPIGTATGVPQNTWTVVNGQYRLQCAPTPNAALGQGRVLSFRSEVYTNFHVSVDIVDWNPVKTNALALCARIGTPGPGTTRGYLFGFISGTNYLDLVRLQNEGTRAIPGVVRIPFNLIPGRGYRMTFTGKDADFVGRLYELTDLNNPIAVLSGSDGTYADGVSGLAVFPLGASVLEAGDATFDNFSAADRDRPKLTAKIGLFGEWLVSWPQFEGEGYTLETKSKLDPAAVWQDLSLSVFPDNDNGTFFYDATGQGDTQFFRLKKTTPLPQ